MASYTPRRAHRHVNEHADAHGEALFRAIVEFGGGAKR